MNIPKKIYQTYQSLESLHPDLQRNIKTIQENHPDWEHIFFSEMDCINFISEHYGNDFLSIYQKIDTDYGAARADFFRYLLVFKCGGVYLDVKSGLTKNLNSILKPEDSFLLSHWGSEYRGWGQYPELKGKPEFQNWFIISEPEHPFLAVTIGDVVENILDYTTEKFGTGKNGVIRTTGPVPYSKVIYKLMPFFSYRKIDSKKEGLCYSVVEQDTNKLRHVSFFTSHYSQMTKPVVNDSLPVCVSQANPGDQQGAKQVISNQKKISPLESINFGGVQISVTRKKIPLTFLCSHERAGIHFLMEALAKNSDYSNKYYFDLDPEHPFFLNKNLSFERTDKLMAFFSNIEAIKNKENTKYFSGFIKSHFYAQFMEKFLTDNRRFIYILRDPADTLISFWRQLHQFTEDKEMAENTYGGTLREFLALSPHKKIRKYQKDEFSDYFSRWAEHANEWLSLSEKNSNVLSISFDNLKRDYTPTLNSVLEVCGYSGEKFCKKPSRQVSGVEKEKAFSESDEELFRKEINTSLKNYPKLFALYGKS